MPLSQIKTNSIASGNVTPALISSLTGLSVANTQITGRLTGTQIGTTAVADNLGYTPLPNSNPFVQNQFHQYAVGSNVAFIMRGGWVTGPGSNWQTVWTFQEYASTAFMLMVSYENNLGDGANRSAIFADSGTGSYGGGFGVNRLTGSDSLECRRSGSEGARTLQVRHSSGNSDSAVNLQWQLFLLPATQG
jgi:hypothetical protein